MPVLPPGPEVEASFLRPVFLTADKNASTLSKSSHSINIRPKKPKNVRNCESRANTEWAGKPVDFPHCPRVGVGSATFSVRKLENARKTVSSRDYDRQKTPAMADDRPPPAGLPTVPHMACKEKLSASLRLMESEPLLG